jgi:hypothetical protein
MNFFFPLVCLYHLDSDSTTAIEVLTFRKLFEHLISLGLNLVHGHSILRETGQSYYSKLFDYCRKVSFKNYLYFGH